MGNLEAALQYAARGWRVFPCHAIIWQAGPGGVAPECTCRRPCKTPGKHPRIKEWQVNASADPAQLEAWWGKWPTANVAIATGSGSNLTVVDLDGAEGFAEFQALERAAGAATPDTLAVQTGSGAHLYFQWSGETTSARGKVHIRAEGGYVIAPPSNHHTGRNYAWLTNTLPAILPPFLKEYADNGARPAAPAIALPDYLQGFQQHTRNLASQAVANLRSIYAPADVAEVESALSALDPDMQMIPWVKVGMALHSLGWERPDGSDLGKALWSAWSSGSKDKYSEWDIDTRWRSFGKPLAPGRAPVTIGTLFDMARKAGWIRARGSVEEAAAPARPASGEAVPAARGSAEAPGAFPEHFPGTNGHASIAAGTSLVPSSVASPQRPMRWTDLNEDGDPKISCANASDAIQHLGICCTKDTFHEKFLVGGMAIEQWAGDLSDDAVQMVRHVIKRVYGLDFGERHIRDAAIQLCLKNQFNPVTDYLADLQWDGAPRLARWVVDYLGCDDTPFNREVGRLTLIAAVRRARFPGTKFDQIVVLEGSQGTYKSTAVRILAGEENYSEQNILNAGDKEQQEAVQGVWLYEIAELAGMRRTETERVKQFASRTVDRARPAYGRFRVDRKRTCIFIATTNQQSYLKDETGNRRFWPLETRRIDIDGLQRDRDQLWAEAALQEAAGASLHLDSKLWRDAAAEQHKRIEEDHWEEAIEAYLHNKGAPRAECGVYEVLTSPPLFLKPEAVSQIAQNRVARILVKLGWEKFRKREGAQLKWRYRPRSG